MSYIVTTRMSNGVACYIGRITPKHHLYVFTPKQARRYATRRTALAALMRIRLSNDIDSAWHHGHVVSLEFTDARVTINSHVARTT